MRHCLNWRTVKIILRTIFKVIDTTNKTAKINITIVGNEAEHTSDKFYSDIRFIFFTEKHQQTSLEVDNLKTEEFRHWITMRSLVCDYQGSQLWVFILYLRPAQNNYT